MIKIITKISLIFICVLPQLKAQQVNPIDTSSTKVKFVYEMQKSPWGAVGRSAVIPGWGQFYNEDYWHIPVVWGVLGWFGYQWVLNDRDYRESRDLFIETGISIHKTRRDFYRDQRDQFTIYFAITYLMNLVDAFVGAHLFDFSVEEDHMTNQTKLIVFYNF